MDIGQESGCAGAWWTIRGMHPRALQMKTTHRFSFYIYFTKNME